MKWLGVDIECNQKGIWNIGLAVFQGRKTLAAINIFVEETFSNDPNDGYGVKYFKSRKTLDKKIFPVWVRTVSDADKLAEVWINSHGFSRSFGYNSSQFDLSKLEGTFPRVLRMLLAKPHLDLMPLVIEHLVERDSYYKFWKDNVAAGNTHEGHPDYCKFSAELVFNYIASIRHKGNWTWKKEDHIGAEDLVQFEYPILHYFVRLLKKGTNSEKTAEFLKWVDVNDIVI